MSEQTDPVRQQREHIESLEAQLAAANERDAANAVVIRENAMLRANVDLDSDVGKMFARAYEGELDVEAIKAGASSVGALKATPSVPDPQPSADELEQARLRGELSADGEPGGAPPPHGITVEETYERFQSELRKGVPREEAAGLVLSEFIAEANAGNPNFLFDADEWRRKAAGSSLPS